MLAGTGGTGAGTGRQPTGPGKYLRTIKCLEGAHVEGRVTVCEKLGDPRCSWRDFNDSTLPGTRAKASNPEGQSRGFRGSRPDEVNSLSQRERHTGRDGETVIGMMVMDKSQSFLVRREDQVRRERECVRNENPDKGQKTEGVRGDRQRAATGRSVG